MPPRARSESACSATRRGRHNRRRRRVRCPLLRGSRCRDHGRGHVRAALVSRRPGLEGVVGRRAAVRRAGLRAHPPRPRPDSDDEGRDHVRVPRRLTGRRTRGRGRRRRRSGRAHGGGATTVRSFLAAGLVDELHVAIAPIRSGGASGSGTTCAGSRTTIVPRRSPPRTAPLTSRSAGKENPAKDRHDRTQPRPRRLHVGPRLSGAGGQRAPCRALRGCRYPGQP